MCGFYVHVLSLCHDFCRQLLVGALRVIAEDRASWMRVVSRIRYKSVAINRMGPLTIAAKPSFGLSKVVPIGIDIGVS